MYAYTYIHTYIHTYISCLHATFVVSVPARQICLEKNTKCQIQGIIVIQPVEIFSRCFGLEIRAKNEISSSFDSNGDESTVGLMLRILFLFMQRSLSLYLLIKFCLEMYSIYMFHKVTFDWCFSQLVVAVLLWSRNDQWRSTRKWGLEIRLWVSRPSGKKAERRSLAHHAGAGRY